MPVHITMIPLGIKFEPTANDVVGTYVYEAYYFWDGD